MRLLFSRISAVPAVQRLLRSFVCVAAAWKRPSYRCVRERGGAFPALVMLAALLPLQAMASPVQGDRIVNSAQLAVAYQAPAKTSVSVAVVIRTQSTTEFLQYAPTISTAESINAAAGYCRAGSDATAPLQAMAPPVLSGASTAIDLSMPVPLVPAALFHSGDPIFIRVTDKDQNLDRSVAETVFTTITDSKTGDKETVRLTETGPDSGVFVGYIQSVSSRSDGTYSGMLRLTTDSFVETTYRDVVDDTDSSAAAVLVDPYGILINSSTGAPVDGAKVTLLEGSTGAAATIYGDDGVSIFPSTITSGYITTDSGGSAYSFPPGGYRFPLVKPGNYILRVEAPTGYSFPSAVATETIQTLSGGPFVIVNPGSRGEQFLVNPGPPIRFDIPLDPLSSPLWVVKGANKVAVSQGEFILYTVTVTNTGTGAAAPQVQMSDRLPLGFRFKSGSVKVDGVVAADPGLSSDGRSLTFFLGDLAAGKSREVRYVVEVSAGTHPGAAINQAQATHSSGGTSNLAKFSVNVLDAFNRSKTLLMGRVMSGPCSIPDTEKAGIDGIRFYMEDGTFVESDKQGLFHFEGIKPGVHVVQLDLESLPKGYEVLSCEENTRFAGRSFSQFVDLKGGAMWRVDFHLKGPELPKPRAINKPTAPAVVPQAIVAAVTDIAPILLPSRGEAKIALKSSLSGRTATFQVAISGATVPMKNLRLAMTLPVGAIFNSDSGALDGKPLGNPVISGNLLTFNLEDKPGDWQHELTFTATFKKVIPAGELPCSAVLLFDSPTANGQMTPVAENLLIAANNSNKIQFPEFTVRPQFPTLVAELSSSDKQMLNELVRLMSVMDIEQIYVTGHTDSVRIAPNHRHLFKDNEALSLARARSVGNYLAEALHLEPSKLVLTGLGESTPIVSNKSAADRALNRRVEVRVKTSRTFVNSGISILKDNSDLKSVPMTGAVVLSADTVNVPKAVQVVIPVGESVPQLTTVTLQGAGAVEAPELQPAPETSREEPKPGILAPSDKGRLVSRYNSVRILFDSKFQQRLMVDGKEVGSDRIGFKMVDPKSGLTLLTYLGIDFGLPGEHTILLEGLDPFGNARFSDTAKVTRTGAVAAIKLLESAGNVADGKTPIRIRLQMVDAAGEPINAEAQMEIRGGNLQHSVADKEASKDHSGLPLVKMDADGWVTFAPTNQSGPYKTELGFEKESILVETYVQPKMRNWILVGMGEGTAGYNTVSGNMEGLKGSGADEDFYKDGRIAFFAKGTIQGKWLLTTAYDSAKASNRQGNSLFQTVNPEAYYTLYGDATQQNYDAASARNLYVKIERDQFYAMFGDYDTGMTVTELSRYSRRLTGAKSELQSKNVEFNLFASDSGQNFAKDEIQGDGTSGLYRMSKKGIVINSERIILEVRDRFKSEVVTSSRVLSRFADYSIDYEAGAIFFKEPVMSRDENLNPIYIVMEYEVDNSRDRSWNYGGRAGVKLLDGAVKAGVSHIHESQGAAAGNLYGIDTTFQLGATRLKGEFASTSSDLSATRSEGNAYLAELAHKTKLLDTKVYFREQDAGFGLGQQAGSESGTRKIGADAALKLSDRFSVSAQGYRQYNLTTTAIRDMEEVQGKYNDKNYSAQLGLRQATDKLADGSNNRSTQLTGGAGLTTLQERLTLHINHDQSVGSNSNSDYPTRTMLGADYKLTRDVTLFAVEELTYGNGSNSESSRAGLRATPWSGGQLSSSVAQETSENSDRLNALFGLKQALQLTSKLTVDGGLDHSRTLKNKSYQFNTNVPPTAGSSSDFTAVSLGANYKEEKWSLVNRLEFRTSEMEKKWGFLTGVVGEVKQGLALSARGQVFTSDSLTLAKINSDIRLGAAYRPAKSRWILLDRIDFLYDQEHGSSDIDSRRIVNSLNANFKPNRETQLSFQYGAKYVWELIDGGSYTGYTDLIGVEGRYDITKSWDVGIQGSLLHSWSSNEFDYSSGTSVGYNVMQNAWISLGYNFCGFTDKDFSASDYTAQGPFVRFRFKFDQNSVKDAAKWLGER